MSIRALFTTLVVLAVAPNVDAGDVFNPWEDTARYEFEYRVPLDAVPLNQGERARLWVPMPAENASQRVILSSVESPVSVEESLDAMGNRMAHLSWEGPVSEGAEAVFYYTVERAPDTGLSPEDAKSDHDDPARFLSPAKRIPLEGMVRRLGEKHAADAETDGEKIRAYYDFVLKHMRYSKQGEGWVPFDASEAWKAGEPDRFFGRIPSDRIAFTLGRDLVLAPPQEGEALNYFIHPYVEIEGETAESVRANYRFRRLSPVAEPS